ncbi:MAG: glycosyltransferase family 2 protein, partial [Cyclobacteriaceae bacterium]
MPEISIIIPVFNEEESLPELHEWIKEVMHRSNLGYELILVDDGSTDDSWLVIRKIADMDPCVRAVGFIRNYGKSAALDIGFSRAEGEVVITMDADLQDSPEEIPALYQMIVDQGYDLVSGWKKRRFDPLSKT